MRERHRGCAAVAAIDEETAIRACKLVDVEYEDLPAFLDPEEALANPSPQIHETPDKPQKGNVSKHVRLEFGDVDGVFDRSDVVCEAE